MGNDDRDMANVQTDASPGRTGWVRSAVIGGLAVAALAVAGLAAATSSEFGNNYGFGRFGMGGHMMHAHMGGLGFGERGMAHVLEEIDATQEQEERLWAIIDSARSDMRPMTREFRDTREAIADILAAPTIDRAAAEKLRSERVASIDAASRRMTTALIDAAEVLTPEQRAKLVERFKERGWHGRW
jgi:periplasmic protein CpxP/Spy